MNFKDIQQMPWMKDIDWTQIEQKVLAPPISIDIYKSYIHAEFQNVEFPEDYYTDEQLFSFFEYIRPDSAALFQ